MINISYERKGFVLYFVIAILTAMGMFVMALTSFKSGAVNMLSQNADQNRLVLAAQAANAETLAYIRSQANDISGNSTFGQAFRDIFAKEDIQGVMDKDFNPSKYPMKITISKVDDPTSNIIKNAKEIAKADNSKVGTEVIINFYHEALWNSVWGYSGYIDVISTAKGAKNRGGNIITVKERRDIRAMELTHYLDKYALFVKCFSPDVNHPTSRVIVGGIPEIGTFAGFPSTRVYLGNYLYEDSGETPNSDDEKNIWLDLYFKEHWEKLNGFKKIFGTARPETTEFLAGGQKDYVIKTAKRGVGGLENTNSNQGGTSFQKLVYANNNIKLEQFYDVKEIRDQYEKTISRMANALLGIKSEQDSNFKFANNGALTQLCQSAINKANADSHGIGAVLNIGTGNNAAYFGCQDYINKAKPLSGSYYSYGNCETFKQVVKTFIASWSYEYAYVDAASIWDIERKGSGSSHEKRSWLAPNEWTLASYSSGLTDIRKYIKYDIQGKFEKYVGPYQYAFKDYNTARGHVGRMLSLYGDPDNTQKGYGFDYTFPTKVIVEGPVFLRFFKLAYLAAFESNIPFGAGCKAYLGDGRYEMVNAVSAPIKPTHVALKTVLLNDTDSEAAFLNKKITNDSDDLSIAKDYFTDRYLMSYAIDTIPINALYWGDKMQEDNGGSSNPALVKTVEKVGEYKKYKDGKIFKNNAEGIAAVRRIDPTCCSFAYDTGKEFVAERLEIRNNKRILHVDGFMYIEGDEEGLTLFSSDNENLYFEGNGLIYLAYGDCNIKNLYKNTEHENDTLRIVLQHGDFNIKKTNNSKNRVEASLCSFRPTEQDPESLCNTKKGKIKFDSQKEVTVYGNVLVDYLYTYRPFRDLGVPDSECLDINGKLIILHDPVLLNPVLFDKNKTSNDASKYSVWISVGSAKSAYSIDAGKEGL